MADIDINDEKSSISVGHFLTFTAPGLQSIHGDIVYNYQNFFIEQNITFLEAGFFFAPFAFSGVTISSDGSGVDASLIFPNNDIARFWSDDAVKAGWYATVRTVLVDPDSPEDFGLLNTYVGRVTLGGWTDTRVMLTVNSVLDAVGAEVPKRKINRSLVGNIPTTSGVRLQ